jgi:hypothetical protein
MADYDRGLQAILAGKKVENPFDVAAASISRSDSSSSDDSSDSDAEVSLSEAKKLVKPGEDLELVQPKNLEMEALWKASGCLFRRVEGGLHAEMPRRPQLRSPWLD